MSVNITEISSVYTTLLSTMSAQYDTMYANDEIDAETYAKLVGQASSQLVTLSAELVQKQEQIDKDLGIKEREMLLKEAESVKQLVLLENQILEEQYKVNILLPDEHNINVKKESEIDKSIDIKNKQSAEEQYKIDTLLPDEHNKSIEQLKEIKAGAILKDKEAVKAGLDKLTKIISTNPEDVYTLKYGV